MKWLRGCIVSLNEVCNKEGHEGVEQVRSSATQDAVSDIDEDGSDAGIYKVDLN